MKVQFDKSQYSTVERSSCLVLVQWMKDKSRTVNPCLLECMYIALVHSLRCVCVCVCVCVCTRVWVDGGIGGGDLR